MILSYSIISSLILVFGYVAYKGVMEGERQQRLNRCLILTLYAAAWLLPVAIMTWIRYRWDFASGLSGSGRGTIEFGELTGGVAGGALTGREAWLSLAGHRGIIMWIYFIGLGLSILYTLFGIGMLVRIIKGGERIERDGYSLVLVDDHGVAPFSWRNTVVMNRRDYEEGEEMILLHECAHLRLRHWTDLLIARLTTCLQWYNPAAWGLERELRAVHEYQADEAVADSGVELKEYQMLLINKAVGYRLQSFANSLDHSKLKKRVTMMYKERTNGKRRWLALLLIPAIGAGCGVTAIPSVAGVIDSLMAPAAVEVQQAPQSGEKVYDAVEVLAEFPGGMEKLMRYLMENMRYPEEAFKADQQGRVIVNFVVGQDGTISDVKVLKPVAPSLDAEAIRVVSAMPKWVPAKVGGKAVASRFTLPVQFKLTSTTSEEEQNGDGK